MPPKPVSRNRSGYDYASYFREMLVQHDLTTMPEDKKWSAVPEVAPDPHSIVLYLGCNVLRTSDMIRNVTDIFDLLGLDYIAVGGPAFCCGIAHDRNGDKELAESMGRSAIRFMERYKPERVAMWCPSCIFYYDEIFQVPTSFETLHVTELLLENVDKLNFVQEVPQRVALHYHNNRPRRIREAEAARDLLLAIPKLEYVEVESDVLLGRSCSAFSQEAIGMDAWQQIIEGHLRQAEEAKVDSFATLYHGCQRTICEFEDKYPFEIEHYLSVFARALGIEHEDTYKKYKLWNDPERVLAEMAPCMKANGVSPDEARKVVTKTFSS